MQCLQGLWRGLLWGLVAHTGIANPQLLSRSQLAHLETADPQLLSRSQLASLRTADHPQLLSESQLAHLGTADQPQLLSESQLAHLGTGGSQLPQLLGRSKKMVESPEFRGSPVNYNATLGTTRRREPTNTYTYCTQINCYTAKQKSISSTVSMYLKISTRVPLFLTLGC
jgi:hypothetical protein